MVTRTTTTLFHRQMVVESIIKVAAEVNIPKSFTFNILLVLATMSHRSNKQSFPQGIIAILYKFDVYVLSNNPAL